jgi:Tol biopolymer transport system component
VAELAFDEDGNVTGVEREYQLTNNGHVNWAPYWHPDGRHLVYATSEMGHRNYEVFIVDADSGKLESSPGPVRYGTNQRRVTFAKGADVLPIFSPDGEWLTWTGQRGEAETSQLWAARFIMPLDPHTTGEAGGPRRTTSVHQDHSSHAGHICEGPERRAEAE